MTAGRFGRFGNQRPRHPINDREGKRMQRHRWRIGLHCSWLILGLTVSGSGAWAADTPPTPAQLKFFETKIRPVLVENCYQCHGADQQKSDLRVDSLESLLTGGALGPAVVPGNLEESLLIEAIVQETDLKMPPKKKLSEQQIADITAWVKMGAPYPKALASSENAATDFWSFRPPQDPAAPAVKNSDWVRSPLDQFVLAPLEAAGLQPAPPADKQTLIRRATFDLTGLPPTPEETAAFLADNSPDAFAKVVERLLASSHYGERWGRHWLDVARYSDSNGLDENVAQANAWRYRDYVVTAFNTDKPYDEFVRQQLAGDLLPSTTTAERHENLIATGFLALGPKVLAEVDSLKMEMDIVDEQVDTVGRAFMGLTMGCARCHNHKFDPILTEDYYGMAGIFKSTRTMETFKIVAKWNENPIASEEQLALKETYTKQLAERNAAIQKVIDVATTELKATLKADEKLPTGKALEARLADEAKAQLKKLREELAEFKKTEPVIPTAMGVTEGKVADATIYIRGNHLSPGEVTPRRFPAILTGGNQPTLPDDHSGRLQLANWLVAPSHPLTSRVMVNRIWRWHFGQGLSRAPDNFGRLGDPPANQPLLDWLAHRFIDSQWSIKSMHRLIMLSSAYQMSSQYDEKAALADPENRLNWRFDIRRLDAEGIRDTLLSVSGLLDRSMGGSLLHVGNREYLFNHTSKDGTSYDSHRRSLYLPVVRNNVYDVFQLFDFADPAVLNGDRASTTVAPQALFLMNSDLVLDAAEALAADLLKQADADDSTRVQRLYAKAYSRPATAAEVTRVLSLLKSFESGLQATPTEDGKRRQQAWSLVCQVVLAANEFIYIR